MQQQNWHALKKEEILRQLKTSSKGLSEREAALRLEKYGKNIIKETYKINPVKIFFKQFKSFLIYILILATLVSLIIKHYVDASVIFAIVLLNSTLGFIQEYKAEKSILKLKKLMRPEAKVFREGKLKKIKAEEVVPGDILVLKEGDKLIADCRLLETENLEVNEAILTGESMPITKITEPLKEKTILAERKNMLFSGTSIVKGSGKAVVVATGMSTEFGKIAGILQTLQLPQTPMQKKLDKFAKQIGLVVLSLAMLIFVLGLLEKQKMIEMFLTSVALAVSAIPEGLPAIITISLAFATNNMARKNVIIRRLPAAETLGSVTIIASDKTGTITEEKMTVREIFCNNKFYEKQDNLIIHKNKKINLGNEKELLQLLKTSVLSSNARFEEEKKGYIVYGDPTESSLVLSALDLGVNRKLLTEREPRIKEISFTSERKMMSILRKGERRQILYSKGASEVIINKSSQELIGGTVRKIDNKRRKQLKKIAESLEDKGYRVLAFAFKFVKVPEKSKEIEDNLIFLGFIALLDPPRKEVKQAIELCKKAGIKVKMITGDSALTAKTIAREIGISGKVITGQELEKMSDSDLKKEIEDIGVFARISPQQKLRIVSVLRKKGEEIAITGDGVNDVLALKKADIGIAMGKRGSDVAREVSDMILIDDNFASIVKAVEEGRIVYDNSKKATKFLLACNFVEIFLIAYSIVRRLPLPLLPLQILWINLITDSFPALALTKEKGEEVMETKPRKEKSILNGIFLFILVASAIALIVELIIFHYALTNFTIEKTRTMVMFTVIGFEALFVFVCRSKKSLGEIGLFSNKWVIYSFFVVILLQILLIYTPLASLFSIVPLTLKEWGYVLLASLPGLVLFETWKLIRKDDKKV